MTANNAEKLLSELFGSRMFVSSDGHITFSTPAQALKETVYGNSNPYKLASALMAVAEGSVTHGRH